MIHVLITVKESERFPGKNRKLAPYTILWLLKEIAYHDEDVKVYTVGKRSELPFRLPSRWQHIQTATEGHLKDIELAEHQIAPQADDIMVLAQLTQPLREHGLLERIVKAVRSKAKSAVTVSEITSHAWRTMQNGGMWHIKKAERHYILNGQLYAWKPGYAADIFNPQAQHAMVLSEQGWGNVDVDFPGDMPPALSAMAGELLLQPIHQPPLTLRNKKVLLIGSGHDLKGRGLGKRIDAGEWDVVVRCNHYYGEPEDVGTRTDLAVVRLAPLEKAFFDEAPIPPKRVVSTNDGNNFPLEIVIQAAKEINHKEASCGLIAGLWLLHMGAKVSVMGIGHYADGTWIKRKTYPDGSIDTANFCDWNKENAWWKKQINVELL